MTYSLYLDDERSPKTDREWVIVRGYDAFVRCILEKGLPQYVSFDHDLGTGPTGHDCVKWLIEYCLDNNLDLMGVETNVHSANPVGRNNIEGLLESFRRSG